MSKHFYNFKGETFEIPTYEEIRDRIYSQAGEMDRSFLDRLCLRRSAEALEHEIEYQKKRAAK